MWMFEIYIILKTIYAVSVTHGNRVKCWPIRLIVLCVRFQKNVG
jgi:hypothetical protein